MNRLYNIEFGEIKKIPDEYGKKINNIFYVIENGRSRVLDNFKKLSRDEKDLIKDLICRLATVPNFRSPKIQYNLKKYNFGEIKPKPHRFFFFQKCGNNYIFFEYVLKKKNSIDDKLYKELNKMKERYEKEFQKYVQGN